MASKYSQAKEPLKILAISAGNETLQKILHHLKCLLPSNAELLIAGKKASSIVLTGVIRMKNRGGRFEELIKQSKHFSNSADRLCSTQSSMDSILMAIDHLQRRSEDGAWSHHQLKQIFDNVHYYHVIVDVLANLMRQEQINLVLFFEVPHLFYDTIIYQIAKSSGVETLILTDSVFKNRFFSTQAIEDIGYLPIAKDSDSTNSFQIDQHEIQNWYYMEGVKQYRGDFGHLCWRGILSLAFNLLAVDKKTLLQPLRIFRLINRMRSVSNLATKMALSFSELFSSSALKVFRNSTGI